MPISGFINWGDIKGGSTDDKHKDWSEVVGFSHATSQPALTTPGGRHPAVPSLFPGLANVSLSPRLPSPPDPPPDVTRFSLYPSAAQNAGTLSDTFAKVSLNPQPLPPGADAFRG